MTRWLTRSEAADYARMSVATFARRIRAGQMPQGHGQHGGKRVWSTDEIDQAISGKQADPIMDRIKEAMGA